MIRKVMHVERILEQTLLYDFYGELLTEHQKQIYEDVVFGDYSLSEVAEAHRISRQGVHDLRKRCDRILEEYEERMHLVERFVRIREQIKRIRGLTAFADESAGEPDQSEKLSVQEKELQSHLREIDRIAASILEEL